MPPSTGRRLSFAAAVAVVRRDRRAFRLDRLGFFDLHSQVLCLIEDAQQILDLKIPDAVVTAKRLDVAYRLNGRCYSLFRQAFCSKPGAAGEFRLTRQRFAMRSFSRRNP